MPLLQLAVYCGALQRGSNAAAAVFRQHLKHAECALIVPADEACKLAVHECAEHRAVVYLPLHVFKAVRAVIVLCDEGGIAEVEPAYIEIPDGQRRILEVYRLPALGRFVKAKQLPQRLHGIRLMRHEQAAAGLRQLRYPQRGLSVAAGKHMRVAVELVADEDAVLGGVHDVIQVTAQTLDHIEIVHIVAI